ncbi:MAG: NusG domain II-containing protein [Clostridiales bacterium]|nr:NusG domain II-containing protein [Candidatus Crickella caballi]
MKKYLTKADIILFIILIALGIASTILVSHGKSTGDKVVITQGGELYGTYSLMEDRSIDIQSDAAHNKDADSVYNTVVIENGKVRMEAASCHNQVCVRHAAISSAGESIICLPNRIVVKIEGNGGGYDAVSK